MTTESIVYDVTQRTGDIRMQHGLYAPVIMRAMNRVYRRLNRELSCLEKKIVFDWGSRGDHTAAVNGNQTAVNQITVATGHDVVTNDEVFSRAWNRMRTVTAYAATTITIDGLPITISDAQEIKTISNSWPVPSDMIHPTRIYPKLAWRDPSKWTEQSGIFTISHGEIIFGSIQADTCFEIWYLSSGYTLVDVATSSLAAGEANLPEWPWTDLHDILLYGTCIELVAKYPQRDYDVAIFQTLYDSLGEAAYLKQNMDPEISGGFGRIGPIDDVYEKPGWGREG